jgi:hypothetical protein
LKNVLHHATFAAGSSGIQLSYFSTAQPPAQCTKVLPSLLKVFGTRYWDGSLADTPIDGHLNTPSGSTKHSQ